MKWLNRLAALLFGLISVGIARDFLDKHDVIILDKEDLEQDGQESVGDIINLRPENYDRAMDLRGTPAHECVCGCNIFNLKVIFSDFQIAQYFIDMECAQCGSLLTAPTPVDMENNQ